MVTFDDIDLIEIKATNINSKDKYFDLSSENIHISRKSPYEYNQNQSFKINIDNKNYPLASKMFEIPLMVDEYFKLLTD